MLKTPWALQIVNRIGTNTTNVARFEIRNTDVLEYNTTKADLAGSFSPPVTSQWYNFDFFLPENFSTGRRGPIIFQSHIEGRGVPPISVKIKKSDGVDTLFFNVFTPEKSATDKVGFVNKIGPVIKGEWQNILIQNQLKPSKDGLNFYLNGKLEYKGEGVYPYQGLDVYPRIGLYTPNKKQVIEDYADKTVVYFDNIRLGPTKTSVV